MGPIWWLAYYIPRLSRASLCVSWAFLLLMPLVYEITCNTDFQYFSWSMVRTWQHRSRFRENSAWRNLHPSWWCHIATSGRLSYRPTDRQSRPGTSLFHPPCSQHTSCCPSNSCRKTRDKHPEKLSVLQPDGGWGTCLLDLHTCMSTGIILRKRKSTSNKRYLMYMWHKFVLFFSVLFNVFNVPCVRFFIINIIQVLDAVCSKHASIHLSIHPHLFQAVRPIRK